MATQNIQIQYGNYIFSPTPLLSQDYKPINLQGQRWGYQNELTLHGYYTGITDVQSTYQTVANIFSGNFQNLSVYDISNGSNLIYSWNDVVLDDISIDTSNYSINGFVLYTAKLKQFDVPSGIINATNEYSFTQNENEGTCDLIHKISAQGIRTQNAPLDNAIAYVGLLSGQNPLTTLFIPYGQPILMGINETIDRITSSYSLVLNYKFVTGSTNNYISVATLNIDQSNDRDYTVLDYNIKYQVSPISGNLSGLLSHINSSNYLNDISNNYGINISNLYQSNFNITQDSQANIVEVKNNFISGLAGDISGYFDYTVTLEKDLITQKNIWNVEGDYISKGPLNFRMNNIAYFKTLSTPYQSYLSNLINISPLNFQYGNSNVTQTNQILDFKTTENTGMAIFKIGISTRDLDYSYNLINPHFEINYECPKWIYEFIPSANIEGFYIIQDLNCLTNSKFNFSVQSNSSGDGRNFINLQTLFNNISGNYILSTGFNIKSSINSGILEQEISSDWLMRDIISGTQFSSYKVLGSFSSSFTRIPGYIWGF